MAIRHIKRPANENKIKFSLIPKINIIIPNVKYK